MGKSKKNNIIWLILAMNVIPFIIAVLTLMMIVYFGIYGIAKISLEGITLFFVLITLPILGIITYTSSFINRNNIEKIISWELGCINSAIWAIVFFVIFIIQLFSVPLSSITSLLCTAYFFVLFYLNQQVCDLGKNTLKLSNDNI